MTGDNVIRARFARETARRKAAAAKPADATTPQQKLVRAAETGRFETIVAAAQPAEPPKMVTPEEREAELRAKGQGPSSPSPVKRGRQGGGKPKARPEASPHLDPPPSDGGGGRELTPNEQYIAEHCQWRRRGPNDYREHVPYGRCKTEYDPLTEEVIGDGYDHSSEEDDAW